MGNLESDKNLVSPEIASAQLDAFDWLVQNLCPQFGPMRSAFQIIENGCFSDMPVLPTEQGTSDAALEGWAAAYIEELKLRLGMKKLFISFVPRDKDLPKRDIDRELHTLNNTKTSERYYTDALGRPIIYFDTKLISKASYITCRAAMAIAEIVRMSLPKNENFSNNPQIDSLNLTAAFLGIGLVPILKSHQFGDSVEIISPKTDIQIFASAIYLALKGYQIDQALDIYGTAICQVNRDRLERAFEQLKSYAPEIKRLREIMMESEMHPETISA